MAVKDMICALHALKVDMPLNWVNWTAARKNPGIFSSQMNIIGSLNLDNLSYNQLLAIEAGALTENMI